MKILTLIIKQDFFDQIIRGEKKEEYREVKPTTASKYIIQDNEEVKVIHYDAIQFYVGYNKNRDSALVELTKAELVTFEDENGDDIIYEYKGEEYIACQMIYSLGKILQLRTFKS